MSTRANEPAYPTPPYTNANGDVQWGANGMELREYFAAMAMQGILATKEAPAADAEGIAAWAVINADALIAQLAKPAMRPHRHTRECDSDCMIVEESTP